MQKNLNGIKGWIPESGTSLNQPCIPLPTQKQDICKLCLEISNPTKFGDLMHHNHLELKISSARGCLLCRFLLSVISGIPTGHNSRRKLHVRYQPGSFSLIDFLSVSKQFDIILPMGIANDLLAPAMSHRALPDYPDSIECFKKAQGWFQKCTESHKECSTYLTTLPTRLIDLSDHSPRLVSTNSLSRSTIFNYFTLSHCWGNSTQRMMLTSSNIEEYSHHIPYHEIPHTFQDAIQVTKSLGFKYLWIDALCILQDSKSDWDHEAKAMGQYYRNGSLNISALSAADGNAGFLHPRKVRQSSVCSNGTQIRESLGSWASAFRQSPLSNRGWVMQERLLSRRILHFGENEMFWECMTCSEREGNAYDFANTSGSMMNMFLGVDSTSSDANFQIDEADGPLIDLKRYISTMYSPFEYGRFASSVGDPLANKRSFMMRWYTIVSQYSGLCLTFDSDVFPAISGIAERFQTITYYTYQGGIFLEDIQFQLLWYRNPISVSPETTTRPDGDLRAPSWSWASSPTAISWLFYESHDMNTDEPSLEFETFKISGEHILLLLKCYIMPVLIRSLVPDEPTRDLQMELFIDVYGPHGKHIGHGYRDYLELDLQSDSPQHCFALAVSHQKNQNLEQTLYFLLVRWIEGTQNFERIGLFQNLEGQYDGLSYMVKKSFKKRSIWLG